MDQIHVVFYSCFFSSDCVMGKMHFEQVCVTWWTTSCNTEQSHYTYIFFHSEICPWGLAWTLNMWLSQWKDLIEDSFWICLEKQMRLQLFDIWVECIQTFFEQSDFNASSRLLGCIYCKLLWDPICQRHMKWLKSLFFPLWRKKRNATCKWLLRQVWNIRERENMKCVATQDLICLFESVFSMGAMLLF